MQSTGMIWRGVDESVVAVVSVDVGSSEGVAEEIWPSRKGEVNIVAKSSERRSIARWAGKRVLRRVLLVFA